jgi:hypothetical protein
MSIHTTVFATALLAGVAAFMAVPAQAQSACESQAQRIQCSEQCCGRKTCTPSCESDCVKACVSACKNPAQASGYTSQLRSYQLRCGNRSIKG